LRDRNFEHAPFSHLFSCNRRFNALITPHNTRLDKQPVCLVTTPIEMLPVVF
jgi:hypothetical protein